MKDNSKFGSSQSLIDAVNEVLRGGQKKLDKNNNGKLDGEDFKKLRGENEVDEVAVSKTQQRAAGAALATQRGEYDGGKKGGAINRMASMKPSDLMKIAGTKTKDLPMRKEESYDLDELSKGTMKSYVKKATTSSNRADAKSGGEEDKAMSTDGNKYPEKQARHTAAAVKAHNTWKKRETGLAMAQNKLRKEEVDLDEAVDFSNHMKNPYHKILDAHGYKHVKSQVVDQGIARHSPHTAHTYNRDGGHIAQVWSYHNGNKPVWHARYKQDNGIMAPGHGETKPALSKYLERRHGSTNESYDLDEFTKKDFASNEDQNMHTENAVELDEAKRDSVTVKPKGKNSRYYIVIKTSNKKFYPVGEELTDDDLSMMQTGGNVKVIYNEGVDLNEFTVSDVEIAMKKKYGKVDKEAIEKLKKVQHMGNVDRNALVKVGHGKLHVESVDLDAETVLHYRSKGGNRLTEQNEDAVTKVIKSIKAMKAKESTNC